MYGAEASVHWLTPPPETSVTELDQSLMTVRTRRSPAFCGETASWYADAPPRSPEKTTGAPTGAIEGLVEVPGASSIGGADATVVATVGASVVTSGVAAAVPAELTLLVVLVVVFVVAPTCRRWCLCPAASSEL
jgi:hypothetical protein